MTVRLNKDELLYLRSLAQKTAALAQSDCERKKLAVYEAINSLQIQKPPVSMFVPASALEYFCPAAQCRLPEGFWKNIEYDLLCRLKLHEALQTDLPVTKTLYSGLCAAVTPWMEGYQTVRATQSGRAVAFEPCINEYSDLSLLRQPELIVDEAATNLQYELLLDALGDILDIQKGTPYSSTCGWGDSVIDQLVEMRGLNNFYIDLIDEPSFVHEAMQSMTEKKLNLLQQYKDCNCLFTNHKSHIGSASFGYTSELPGSDFSPQKVLPHNLWGFAQAQELSGVSLDMLDEFILPYQASLTKEFGLVAYGCCEPMDTRIPIIEKHIKNLRLLSVSPFSDLQKAAELSQGRYVLACKLHPSLVVGFNETAFAQTIVQLLERTQNCPTTIIFAEIMNYDAPPILVKAVHTAKKTIDQFWKSHGHSGCAKT